MDPAPWVEAVGGGLAGAVIVAQGGAIWLLWRRLNEVSDKLLDVTREMGRENRELLTATNTAMIASTTAMKAAADEMRRARP